MASFQEVSYFRYATPPGEVVLVFRTVPSFRLLATHLAFGASARDLEKKARAGGWGKPSTREAIQPVIRLLEAYATGTSIAVPWEWLELEAFTPLEVAVFRATSLIPFGECRTYREIAAAIGRSRAFRFVGNTLGKNPYPILIPCHRVIRSNGTLGGFGGGLHLKEALLEFESRQAGLKRSC